MCVVLCGAAVPLPVEAILTIDTQFAAYEQANQQFAAATLRVYKPGDVVWVHGEWCTPQPRVAHRRRFDKQ